MRALCLHRTVLHGQHPRLAGLLVPVHFSSSSRRVLAPRAAAETPDAADEAFPASSSGDPRSRMLQRRQRRLARRAADESEAAPVPAAPSSEGSEPQGPPTPASRVARARSTRSSRLRRRGSAVRPRVPAPLTADDLLDEDEDTGLAVDAAWDEDEDEEEQQQAVSSKQTGTPAALDDDEAAEEAAELQAMLAQARGDTPSVPAPADASTTATTSSTSTSTSSSNSSSKEWALWSRARAEGSRAGPVELPERSPMYLPVLTDEDLAADPPGHKSGYVAVIGKPNAGKSTLINALVGQKLSIVTFKPQTTRHRVVGIASEEDYQMILFDTPGIMREQRSKLDERMMRAVVSSIQAAEAIIAVVDAADDPQDALGMFQPGPDWNGPPMAVLLNKADLVGQEQLAALEGWYRENCRAQAVFVGSAKAGGGEAAVGEVKAWAVKQLPEGPTLYPKQMVSEQPERFFVSEIIREKIFLRYSDEIPYASQVLITEFKERPGAKDYVAAKVLVERDSQKGILVGRGGQALRALGEEARRDIEAFLERPVYLELSVEVAPDWRKQTDRLKDFGYYDPLYVS